MLGKEPIFLLFATPQFCQSRVCGPVVDVAEQVKDQFDDKAAFIHMEIYNDKNPSNLTVLPQVRAFRWRMRRKEAWTLLRARDSPVTMHWPSCAGFPTQS